MAWTARLPVRVGAVSAATAVPSALETHHNRSRSYNDGMNDLYSDAHARALDAADVLPSLRGEFLLPRHGEGEQAYFCGNSLGLQPRAARAHVDEVLDKW